MTPQFRIGDKVKFKEGATVPFRIRSDSHLLVRQVSYSGAVRIGIGQGSVWVKGELLEPADDAAGKEEEVAG